MANSCSCSCHVNFDHDSSMVMTLCIAKFPSKLAFLNWFLISSNFEIVSLKMENPRIIFWYYIGFWLKELAKDRKRGWNEQLSFFFFIKKIPSCNWIFCFPLLSLLFLFRFNLSEIYLDTNKATAIN